MKVTCPLCKCSFTAQSEKTTAVLESPVSGLPLQCLRLLAAFPDGMTDDEVDTVFKKGHQSVTPAMRKLRYQKLIEWFSDNSGEFVCRKTRRGKSARINFITPEGKKELKKHL